MNLRQKLFTVFGGLALLSLATAGVTVWATFKWQASNKRLEAHYRRSLLLEHVRATTFRAYKEVADAVTGVDTDARQVLGELVRNAIAALPESGGKLGLRASINQDDSQLLLEVFERRLS